MGFELPQSELAAPRRGRFLGKLGITAGVLDAAMSSFATFLGGLVAANLLSDSELGVYAVFFTAFNFGQVIANNLVYIPAEVVAVAWAAETRMQVLRQSIPIGMLPSLVGAAAIGIATLVGAQIATASLVVPLAITTGLTTLLWPTQDHIRRMLHIADRSWAAAAVSTIHFLVTGLAIGILIVIDVDDAWIPFGALAIANMVSLLIGLILARPPGGARPAPERLHLRSLTRSGVWLMLGMGVPPVAAFGAATIITFAAGPEALGYAEAARIVAHPIIVLGTGLGYVMGPRIMRGAIARDRAVSRHNHRRFNSFLVVATVTYALIVGWQWPGNPMSFLVPKAYVIEWLVVITIVANVFLADVVLVVQELTAAKRARTIALVSIFSVPLQLLAAATAGITEAFARPISLIVGNGSRLYGNTRAIADIYEAGDRTTEPQQ
jgi:O-antigen/teichoic acid export membrane protein